MRTEGAKRGSDARRQADSGPDVVGADACALALTPDNNNKNVAFFERIRENISININYSAFMEVKCFKKSLKARGMMPQM